MRLAVAVILSLSLPACDGGKSSPSPASTPATPPAPLGGGAQDSGTTPDAATVANATTAAPTTTLPSGPAPKPIEPGGPAEGYTPAPIAYDASLVGPTSLSLPALRTDIDPLTFLRAYTHASLRAAPATPAHSIVFPRSAQGFTLPPCDFPIAAPDIKRTEALTIDGSLADWGGKGLVAIDRAGDGAENLPERDIRALYVGESATHWYVFVQTEAPPAGAPADKGPFVLDMTAQKFLETRDPIVRKRVRQIVYGPSGWKDWRGDEGYKDLDPTSVQVAMGIDGIEIAMAKSDPIMASLAPFFSFYAVFGDGPVNLAGDRAASPMLGFAWDYTCLVPTPTRTKMLVMERLPSIPANQAEIGYRAAVIVVPTDEHLVGAEVRITDTVPVAIIHQGPAGTWGGPNGIFTDLSTVLGLSDFVGPLAVAAHEYGHGYNNTDWQVNQAWLGEGHSDLLKMKAVGDFFGPLPRALAERDAIDIYLAAEREAGHVLPLDHFNESVLLYPSHMYSKSMTFLKNLETRMDPADFTAVVAAKHATPQEFLDDVKDAPSFTGSVDANSWNGWVFGSSYSGALFPPPAIGTPPMPAFSDRMVADHAVADWETLAPSAWKTPAAARATKITSALCVAGTHMTKFGAMYDGDTALFALKLDAVPPVSRVVTALAYVTMPGTPWTYDIRNQYGDRRVIVFKLGAPAGTPGVQTAGLLNAASGDAVEWFQRSVWLGWPKTLPVGTKVSRIFVYASDGTTEGECDAVTNQDFTTAIP